MRNKSYYLFVSILFVCISMKAQMFDYTAKSNKSLKVEYNKYNELINTINNGFNAFEENLRALSIWEVNQYKRVILEIQKETEGMSSHRKESYKNKKLTELSILLNDKEMELQFQYIELVDYFNEKAIEYEIDIDFMVMMQIEGRLQDAIFKMATEQIEEEKEQNNLRDNISLGTEATLSLATASASTGAGLPIAVSLVTLELMATYTVDKLVSEFLPDLEEMTKLKSWYFINGLCIHARKTYIEQINLKRKL